MDSTSDVQGRTRVRRDINIVRVAMVGYLVLVLLGGSAVGLRWWGIGILALGVLPFMFVVMQELSSRTLLEIAANPPRAELQAGASASEFADVFAPDELDAMRDFSWVRLTCDGRPDIVAPMRHVRTADATTVVSVGGIGNVTAMSRLRDGRWFTTQWMEPFPLDGVIVQVVPRASAQEVLRSHREGLAVARGRGCEPVEIHIIEAAQEIQDRETAAIEAMTWRDRRRAAKAMAGAAPQPVFDPAVF